MLGIPAGLLYANAGEWFIHKHVLHRLGRKKSSFWSFHWHEHHKNSRRNDGTDPTYARFPIGNHAQGKELLGLVGISAAHVPLFPVAPFFVSALWGSVAYYYWSHKKAHQEPEWGEKYLGWHMDHHLGRQQDANWCVTQPWFDYIMKTRVDRKTGEPLTLKEALKRDYGLFKGSKASAQA